MIFAHLYPRINAGCLFQGQRHGCRVKVGEGCELAERGEIGGAGTIAHEKGCYFEVRIEEVEEALVAGGGSVGPVGRACRLFECSKGGVSVAQIWRALWRSWWNGLRKLHGNRKWQKAGPAGGNGLC